MVSWVLTCILDKKFSPVDTVSEEDMHQVTMSRICNPSQLGIFSGTLPPPWRARFEVLGNHKHLDKPVHLNVIFTDT